jgi:hypothetical protein
VKKFWSRFFKVCAGVAVLGGIGVAACLQHPLFGELPSGERLARIARSPNHAEGVFRNQIDTPMKTTDQPEWSMWMETIFGKKGQPRPRGAIPAVKTDLKALDPAQDLVVWLGHSSYFVQLGGTSFAVAARASGLPGESSRRQTGFPCPAGGASAARACRRPAWIVDFKNPFNPPSATERH